MTYLKELNCNFEEMTASMNRVKEELDAAYLSINEHEELSTHFTLRDMSRLYITIVTFEELLNGLKKYIFLLPIIEEKNCLVKVLKLEINNLKEQLKSE